MRLTGGSSGVGGTEGTLGVVLPLSERGDGAVPEEHHDEHWHHDPYLTGQVKFTSFFTRDITLKALSTSFLLNLRTMRANMQSP